MTQFLPLTTPAVPATRDRSWRRWYLAGLTALTAYSAGIGWQAQLVSYPFFGTVPAEHFAAYHQQYNQAIPVVVILPGFLSFLAGIAFLWARPRDVSRPAAAVVAGTGLVSLLATALWAIPMHDRLDQLGQSAATLDSLLQANLLRSLALTAGTVVLVWCTAKAVRR
jgi:hypothetical protein